MSLQELKNQAYKLSVSDRLELVNAIIQSLQRELRPRPPVPEGTLTQLRGLLKTDAPPPTDDEIKDDYVDYLIKNYE